MNNELNDISQGNNWEREKLLRDLNEALHSEENFFEKDADEGLQQIPNKHVSVMVNELNLDLQKQIAKKKRKKINLPDQSAVYVTVIILLILLVVAYIIIRKVLS